MKKNLNFMVVGETKINCAGCEERIGKALKRLPGIEQVQASAQTQQVKVVVDSSQTTPDQVRTKLEQLGYTLKAD